MTDKAVSALTSLTGANTATGDLLYIVDISEAAAADRSKKITAQEFQNYVKAFPATIGVGGATPAASGAGISFPATASASSDANTLDDYEEGSWTPTIVTSNANQNISYNIQNGLYVKIGRLVKLSFYIQTNAVTSQGTGTLRISGIPSFTPATQEESPGSFWAVSGLDSTRTWNQLTCQANAAGYLLLLNETGNLVSTGNIGASSYAIGQVSYIASA